MFYATVVVLADSNCLQDRCASERCHRPRRAAMLPMFVEDDIMTARDRLSGVAEEVDDEQEFEKFDEFVHTLSPDDF